MQVHVHLPNGDGCSVEVSAATPISELTAVAQQHFQRRLKLTAKGRFVPLAAGLAEAQSRSSAEDLDLRVGDLDGTGSNLIAVCHSSHLMCIYIL